MSASPDPSAFKQLISDIVTGLAKSIASRRGETPEQKLNRFRVATQMVLAFFPRDIVEMVLASRVVLFHEVTCDAAQEMLAGQTDPMRRATRGQIVAMDRCFQANLAKLEQYQARRADAERDVSTARPAQVASAETASQPPAPDQTAAEETDTPITLPPRAVEAIRRNKQAQTALAAGDPIAFGKAMGIENPAVDLETAVTQWTEFLDALAEPDAPMPIAAE
jgi:hypothetical protein